MSWVVSFLLPANENALELLLWLTSPLSPSLRTRTDLFSLVGWYWVEVADDVASCQFEASWPAAWIAFESIAHEHGEPPEPPWLWSMPCVSSFLLPANDFAVESLLWFTSPLSPPLSTRTEMFSLLGWYWVDVAVDVASCEFEASWPAACIAFEPMSQPHRDSREPPKLCSIP